jgi:hydrogenase maturation protein HypF
VPIPVVLPVRGEPVLALGGELKATSCLSDGHRAWLSQHIGDMGGLPALRALETTIERTEALHELSPDELVVDAHPGYTSHRWAHRHAGQRRVRTVQHHHAHVAALLAEHGRTGPLLGIAFDGTGYGTDGTIWGGEVLLADLRSATRVAHLSATPLPGGDSAIRHPRRVALSHLRTAGVAWDGDLPPVAATAADELALLARQLDRGVAQVPTTSMGRLFDAVSSLLGVRHDITYEAQAAIELELLATDHAGRGGQAVALTLRCEEHGDGPAVLRCDELVVDLVAALRAGAEPAALALGFHQAVAETVAAVATAHVGDDPTPTVGLTGGVFANALLVELTTRELTNAGVEVLRHRVVPTNDGGLALGQAAIGVARSAAVATPDPLD